MKTLLAIAAYTLIGLSAFSSGDKARTWPVQLAFAIVGLGSVALAFCVAVFA